jgi:phosphatidylinositol 4-phosphatase
MFDSIYSDTLPNVDEATRTSIHGIIGIIHLISGPYLIVITAKIRVGDINGHTIYKVQGTDMIPYARNMSHLNEYQV